MVNTHLTSRLTAFLSHLMHLGVTLALDRGQLIVNDERGRFRGEVKEAVRARETELIEHLEQSPGAQIRDYPTHYRMMPLAFQEMLIEEHERRGRVHRGRWLFDLDAARIVEIARELGME